MARDAKRMTRTLRRLAVVAPFVGAGAGGLAGAALGAEYGLAGGALGGISGYVIQKRADRLAEQQARRAKRPIHGGTIFADTRIFVGRSAELKSLAVQFAEPGSRVCILYGFGGCGKSAAAKIFLERRAAKSRKREILFTWGFNQDPSLESFFAALGQQIRFEAGLSVETQESHLTVVNRLAKSGRKWLLVLDGLESVTVEDQEHSARDGSLAVPALRVLLQRAADGAAGELKILITTRVVPPELIGSKSVATLDFTQLSRRECVELLRRHKVHGDTARLEQVAHELRQHAFSISLMGRILSSNFRGDVRQAPTVIGAEEGISTPLRGILKWYETNLSGLDLALLEAVALFRYPLALSDAVRIVEANRELVGSASGAVASSAPFALSRLQEHGLVYEDVQNFGAVHIGLHPIVREYFYVRLTNQQQLHSIAASIVEARLPERADIGDAGQFATLQELVFQLIGANEFGLAWRVYKERIGGYPAIGYRLANHPAGTSILETFRHHLAAFEAATSPETVLDLQTDAALYLKNEGLLDEAIAALSGVERRVPVTAGVVSSLLVRAGIELTRGELGASLVSIAEAERIHQEIRTALDGQTNTRLDRETLSREAAVLFATGRGGISEFELSRSIEYWPGTVPHDYGPIRHVWALGILGRYEDAEAEAQRGLEYLESIGAQMLVQRVAMYAAFAATLARKAAEAKSWVNSVTDWALKADLQVAVLLLYQEALAEFTWGSPALADEKLEQARSLAGNSGYLLEWLDLTAIRATLLREQGRSVEAVALAQAVIDGDRTTYFVPLKGALHPSVLYVWPLAAVLRILDKTVAEIPSAPPVDLTQVHRSDYWLARRTPSNEAPPDTAVAG